MSARMGPITLVIMTICLLSQSASAVCVGEANIVAEQSVEANSPAWTYTLTIDWTYVYGIHHWVLPLDPQSGTCNCVDFESLVEFGSASGTSNSTPEGCDDTYTSILECNGDPNSGMTGIVMTFTPDLSGSCTLGDAGTAVITILSDAPPTPIAEDFYFASANQAGNICGMPISGVFPSLSCDPVSSEKVPWGTVKSAYR